MRITIFMVCMMFACNPAVDWPLLADVAWGAGWSILGWFAVRPLIGGRHA